MAVVLDKKFWDKNKPKCLKKCELDKCIAQYDKTVKTAADKKWVGVDSILKDVAKIIELTMKAIVKDMAEAKKAKDKKAEQTLKDLQKDVNKKKSEYDKYFVLGALESTTAKNSGSGSVPSAAIADAGGGKPGGAGGLAVVKVLINAADKAWGILKDGKPVLTTGSKYCQAVPKEFKFTDLSGWKTFSGSHSGSQKNFLGMKVIEFDLTLSFQHHGSSLSSGGFFLTNYTIFVKKASVLWGFTCDINATVSGSPFNSGKPAFPVGAIPLTLSIMTGGMLQTKSKGFKYTAHGDGKLELS